MAKKTMRLLLTILILSFFVLSTITAYAGPGDSVESIPEQYSNHSETIVTGHSRGNHELDCTVIRPWGGLDNELPVGTYPVIVWANGWGWNNNAGESTTLGYKPGLIEWALSGPYIVVAANAWSAQESDVLRPLHRRNQ